MRVLITGSTGLLGKGLEETADGGHEIIGIHRRDYRVKDPRARHQIADICDAKAIDELFARENFDAVIHAAGMASVDHVQAHPEDGRKSNLEGTRTIARACKRHGAFMVYISTNAVFDGEHAPYRESDPAHPLHHYGRIKLECERATEELSGVHCIVRPILMYGWNHAVNRPNPITWVYEKLLRGERVQLVNDVFENPLYNRQCGQGLWAILKRKPAGIFHFAGSERTNRYALGRAVAEAFGLDSALIEEVDSSYFPSIAIRPRDTTFFTDRMEKELGVKALSIKEGLQQMKEEMGIGI